MLRKMLDREVISELWNVLHLYRQVYKKKKKDFRFNVIVLNSISLKALSPKSLFWTRALSLRIQDNMKTKTVEFNFVVCNERNSKSKEYQRSIALFMKMSTCLGAYRSLTRNTPPNP
jgi:hypothetical protein